MGYVAYQLPDYMKRLLVSMLDDEPTPLGLSDALALGMMGLVETGGEQRSDGWYYTLTDKGRRVARDLAPSFSDKGEGSR